MILALEDAPLPNKFNRAVALETQMLLDAPDTLKDKLALPVIAEIVLMDPVTGKFNTGAEELIVLIDDTLPVTGKLAPATADEVQAEVQAPVTGKLILALPVIVEED